MSRKKELKVRNVFIIYFFLFFLVAMIAPVMQDDWTWGSWEGLRRLSYFFQGYNGRYVGNILVLILTRIPVVFRALCCAGMITAILYMLYRILHKNQFILLFLMLFTIIMPSMIQTEVYFWIPGFSNYVPSLLGTLIFIYLGLEVFKGKKYKKYQYGLFFVVGFMTQLMLENITIYNLLTAIVLMIAYIIKQRKLNLLLTIYTIAFVLGTIVMFINPSYHGAKETYRSIQSPINMGTKWLGSIWKTYIEDIVPLWMNKVFVIHIVISLLCIILVYNQKEKIKWLFITFFSINIGYFISMAIIPAWDNDIGKIQTLEGIYLFIYCGMVIAEIVMFVKDENDLWRLLFFCVSEIFMVAPLFMANPLPDRCFYNTYICFVMFAAELLYILIRDRQDVLPPILGLTIICLTTVVVILFCYFGVFYKMKKIEKKRVEYIAYAQKRNMRIIYLPSVPYNEFAGSLTTDPHHEWWRWYRVYYGLEVNIHETPKFIKNYNKWEKKYYSKMKYHNIKK